MRAEGKDGSRHRLFGRGKGEKKMNNRGVQRDH